MGAFQTRISNYMFPTKKDDVVDDNRTVRHHQYIKDTGGYLERKSTSINRRVEAVTHLGMLAYTGGYSAALLAFEYIPLVMELLRDPAVTDEQTRMLLQALANICYTHAGNQRSARLQGVVTALVPYLEHVPGRSIHTRQWSCYLLEVLCYKELATIRELTNSQPQLRGSLEVLVEQDWEGWPRNYAVGLLEMLALQPTGACPFTDSETGQQDCTQQPSETG